MTTHTPAEQPQHAAAPRRVRVHHLREAKSTGRQLTMLTAYDGATARIFDAAGVDMLLVGDSIGDNMLVETAASGAPQVGAAGEEGRGILRSGMLEGSNVNVVEELVDMIETQRAYEVNSKMIQATDEMMKNATQTL